LLAISIAADIVAMTGENRVLAKLGLKTLRKTRNLGLRLLIPQEKFLRLIFPILFLKLLLKLMPQVEFRTEKQL
jgi:single-stranded DNA-specific DHH superfamily exonuclease